MPRRWARKRRAARLSERRPTTRSTKIRSAPTEAWRSASRRKPSSMLPETRFRSTSCVLVSGSAASAARTRSVSVTPPSEVSTSHWPSSDSTCASSFVPRGVPAYAARVSRGASRAAAASRTNGSNASGRNARPLRASRKFAASVGASGSARNRAAWVAGARQVARGRIEAANQALALPALERRQHRLGGLERRGLVRAAAGEEDAHLRRIHLAAQARVLRAHRGGNRADVGEVPSPTIPDAWRRARRRPRRWPAATTMRGQRALASAAITGTRSRGNCKHALAQQPRDQAMRCEPRDHHADHGEHAQLREAR